VISQTITDLEIPDTDEIFVVCFGSSLLGFDWNRLKDKYTIGVNDAIRKVPNLNIHLFSDKDLWNARYKKMDYHALGCKLVCRGVTADDIITGAFDNIDPERIYGFQKTNGMNVQKIKPDDERLYMSQTVLCPAIVLAWKLQARTIYVLGFDCYDSGMGKRRITYADGKQQPGRDKGKYLKETKEYTLRKKHKTWHKQADHATNSIIHAHNPEVKIYNLSEKSTYNGWEKVSIDTVL
jgi:hypothetical protein